MDEINLLIKQLNEQLAEQLKDQSIVEDLNNLPFAARIQIAGIIHDLKEKLNCISKDQQIFQCDWECINTMCTCIWNKLSLMNVNLNDCPSNVPLIIYSTFQQLFPGMSYIAMVDI